MEKRKAPAAETRGRILHVARQALAWESELSVDAIAGRADISRLTIHHHFHSRPGLLEVLDDCLGTRGQIQRLAECFPLGPERQRLPTGALYALVSLETYDEPAGAGARARRSSRR